MKFRLVVSLVAVAAISSLMSMEIAPLNFITDFDCYIVGHPKEISVTANLRTDFFFVMQPSGPETFDAFRTASSNAVEKKETIKFPCLLNQKNFIAKLTALEAEQKNRNVLFIKLQETFMTPQKSKSRLNFVVDNGKRIRAYSKENMEFALEPSEFVGKNIIDVLPLSKEDREAVAQGFCTAVEKNETVKVPYVLKIMVGLSTLEQKDFVAKITAMKYTEKDENIYFVKVQEAKK